MEIYVARRAGFCFGVKRAMGIARNTAQEGGRVYTLGPLIHNPQAVEELERSGIVNVDDLNEVDGGRLIIRSHGITLSEMAEIEKRGIEFVDATCPFVKKAQEHVKRLAEEGYFVVIVGDKDHPEVKGLVSYGGSEVIAIKGVEEIDEVPRRRRIGVVAQTTQRVEVLKGVAEALIPRASELRIYNTICNATTVRQEESVELAKKVDCMIVVGGYNSANTNRLARLCREIQERTYHIEVADEIRPEWLRGVRRVGITAGASTPQWIIDEVVERVREMGS